MSGIFKRVEKKYLLTKEQSTKLIELLGDRIEDDRYTDYTICNVYYDTKKNDLIRWSLDKPKYKEKFRLRCYGEAGEDTTVYLELKKKKLSVTPLGIGLLNSLPDLCKNPVLTAMFESELKKVESGEKRVEEFELKQQSFVKTLIETAKKQSYKF